MNQGENLSSCSEEKVIRVPISKVVPGMIIARDVYSKNDQLILNSKTVLDANMITKIMFYAVESISVYEDTKKQKVESVYSNEIRKSYEFREFKRAYDTVVVQSKSLMNHILEKNGTIRTEQLTIAIKEMVSNCSSTIKVFQMLHCIREYDDPTYIHSVNVALICNVFGEWLHMEKEEKDILTLCGLMHDIGKLKIPKKILDKPDVLTQEEFEIIKTHPFLGYQILFEMDIDDRIKKSALYHHERYQGNGYPKGLVGNEINAFPMIVSIADTFDAMTSDRVYRAGICPFEVIKQFEEDGIHQYAPQYLIPLLEKIVGTYIHQTVRLSNDMQGEIIMINQHALSKPVIKVKSDIIDLSVHRHIRINAVL